VPDILRQVVASLRANKLRSVLTMFGILWGVVSVVILSATGEGFRRGNQAVLEELGRNVVIVWGGRASAQAGGERAGRRIFLTPEDVRALSRESSMLAVVSAEIQRNNIQVKSRFNAGALTVDGIEPQYQQIRTIDIESGRRFGDDDERNGRRVAIIGADTATQLFSGRNPMGEELRLNGIPYTVVGRIRKKAQDSSYNGRDNEKVFVPFTAMARDFPLTDVPDGTLSQIVLSPRPALLEGLETTLEARVGRVADIRWPLHGEIRRVLSARHGFDRDDPDALRVWDTNLESLMFGRMIGAMQVFFVLVGVVTLGLGGVGVMNIMLVAVRERTREIGVRKALGATSAVVLRQFFLEGFLLTALSGVLGFILALGLCALVNLLPMPERFQGMVVTWQTGLVAVVTLTIVGVSAALLPARHAARLSPVEALRFEA
jgi:putative ABC transport system permease protein